MLAAVARGFGGGGHKNAAGCSVRGTYPEARAAILEALTPAIAAGVLHDPDVPALA